MPANRSCCSLRMTRLPSTFWRHYLEGSGYDVTVARDGLAALAAVRRDRPAAVVLDIGLPGLAGWEVLSRIKADPATAATAVVVASVLDDRKRGLSLGASDYLVKPVSRDDLLAVLAEALRPSFQPASGGVEPT